MCRTDVESNNLLKTEWFTHNCLDYTNVAKRRKVVTKRVEFKDVGEKSKKSDEVRMSYSK